MWCNNKWFISLRNTICLRIINNEWILNNNITAVIRNYILSFIRKVVDSSHINSSWYRSQEFFIERFHPVYLITFFANYSILLGRKRIDISRCKVWAKQISLNKIFFQVWLMLNAVCGIVLKRNFSPFVRFLRF